MENEQIQSTIIEPEKPIVVPPHSWKPKKTHVFIVILSTITILLLIFALFAGATLPKNSTSKTNLPAYVQTTLRLTMPKIVSPSFYQSEVQISTNQNKITAVGLRISFDPKVLSNVDIKMGSFFTSPSVLAKNINMTKGVIAYDLVLPPGQSPVTGKGTVAIISFSTTQIKNPITLNLLSTTKVMDPAYNVSVLKTISGTTFTAK